MEKADLIDLFRQSLRKIFVFVIETKNLDYLDDALTLTKWLACYSQITLTAASNLFYEFADPLIHLSHEQDFTLTPLLAIATEILLATPTEQVAKQFVQKIIEPTA